MTTSRYLAVQSQEDHHEEEAAGPERREGQHHHSPGVGDESQAGACSKEQKNTAQCLGGLQAACDPKTARCGSRIHRSQREPHPKVTIITPKLPREKPPQPPPGPQISKAPPTVFSSAGTEPRGCGRKGALGDRKGARQLHFCKLYPPSSGHSQDLVPQTRGCTLKRAQRPGRPRTYVQLTQGQMSTRRA